MFPQHFIILHFSVEGQRVSQGQCSAEGGDGPGADLCFSGKTPVCCLGRAGKTMTLLVVGIEKFWLNVGVISQDRSFVSNLTELNIMQGSFI